MNFIPFFEGVLWSISPIGLPLSISLGFFIFACIINIRHSLSPLISIAAVLVFLPFTSFLTLKTMEKGLLAGIFLLLCSIIFLTRLSSAFFPAVSWALAFFIGFIPNSAHAHESILEVYFYSLGVCVPFLLWFLTVYFLEKDFSCLRLRRSSVFLCLFSALILPFFYLGG